MFKNFCNVRPRKAWVFKSFFLAIWICAVIAGRLAKNLEAISFLFKRGLLLNLNFLL